MTTINFSGFSSYFDYNSLWWKKSFILLEKVQRKFLDQSPHPLEYRWPIDSLHNFIRSWEYPYVYQVLLQMNSLKNKKILDLGSGITFFPYAIAEKGAKVIAYDNDPISRIGFDKLNKIYPFSKNPVRFVLGDALKISKNLGLFDVIYCVSVLEHIPNNKRIIKHLSKILKSNGLVILTFDVNLNENPIGLSPKKYVDLRNEISKYFELVYPERSVSPLNLVSTKRSKYPLRRYSTLKSVYWKLIHMLKRKKYLDSYDITSIALVLRKKA